jgi:hypothetical protein
MKKFLIKIQVLHCKEIFRNLALAFDGLPFTAHLRITPIVPVRIVGGLQKFKKQ